MAKTVVLEGTFEVKNAAGEVEGRKVTKSTLSVEEATQHFPFKLPAATPDQQITMGGVAQSKKLMLRVDNEVTLKFNNVGDTGFTFGPGDMWLETATGITGVWVTTGPNVTLFEAIFTGE